MCLYAISDIQIATEDIEVYKIIIKENNRSMFRHFQYTPFTSYYSNDLYFSKNGTIHEGFHAFTNYLFARDFGGMELYTGYYKIVKFVIPKGAQYVNGARYEIVSSRIKTLDLENVYVQ